MRKMFQYRIYPTRKQLQKLQETLEECRWLYNHLLAERRETYEQTSKSLSLYGQQATFPKLKQDRTSLESVHSQVLQNVAVRVDLAFKAFFRRVKEHAEDPGYPCFKGKGRYDSFTFPQSGLRLTHNSRVYLSKIGSIKMIYHRPILGKVKTCTIQRNSTDKWYVSFSVEIESARLPACDSQVGIDVGLKTFATLSDGEEIPNPRFFRKDHQRLWGHLCGRPRCEEHDSPPCSCQKHCRCLVVGLLCSTLLQSGRSWQEVRQSESRLYESDPFVLWDYTAWACP